jgi:hypothetical protein
VLRDNPMSRIISDEIYQHICYVPFTSFRSVRPICGPHADRERRLEKLCDDRLASRLGNRPQAPDRRDDRGAKSDHLGCVVVSQAAAVAALTGDQQLLAERCDDFRARRDMVAKAAERDGPDPLRLGRRCLLPVPRLHGHIRQDCPLMGIEKDADFCRSASKPKVSRLFRAAPLACRVISVSPTLTPATRWSRLAPVSLVFANRLPEETSWP